MTQVFFLLSFPYNNATLEKGLRGELHKHNFSLVYCQNIFSFTGVAASLGHKARKGHKADGLHRSETLPPFLGHKALYAHAQCRGFLLWKAEDGGPQKPLLSLDPAVGKDCVAQKDQKSVLTYTSSTLQQLHAWTHTQQPAHRGAQKTSIEKICTRYNAELFAAAVTHCKSGEGLAAQQGLSSLRKLASQKDNTKKGKESVVLLSADEVRRLAYIADSEFHIDALLDHSLRTPSVYLNDASAKLLSLLELSVLTGLSAQKGSLAQRDPSV